MQIVPTVLEESGRQLMMSPSVVWIGGQTFGAQEGTFIRALGKKKYSKNNKLKITNRKQLYKFLILLSISALAWDHFSVWHRFIGAPSR